MVRRKSKNVTGISRLEGIPYHDAWVSYICVSCYSINYIRIGDQLLDPLETFDSAVWQCRQCEYLHSKDSDVPLENWPEEYRDSESLTAERFWLGFFRIATEHKESYWKQCNVCGRILPFHAFSKHSNWGPLERQMECRGCKGSINAVLNPLRTRQQHHEAAVRRRIADLLIEDDNEHIDIEQLFERFDGRCFKTKKTLNVDDRSSWAIDHILPSKYLYPLSKENAALLSTEANSAKRDKWPSKYYTNNELIELAKITGANLSLLANKSPVVNQAIDVNNCVSRFLTVREKSDLVRRIGELKTIISSYNLIEKLSSRNRKILGY